MVGQTRLISSLLRRNASSMARLQPASPWVAIMGTTGTGKSDLAVDLALKFNGEIINADAMQLYRGLPIITNQISTEEQKGVPHHLIATIDHCESTWSVPHFAREARRIMSEIRQRGKLPIVVGGTHYYINSLLFEDTILDENNDGVFRTQQEISAQFLILDGPTEVMFKRLQEVDPAMAERWHPDDRRKIKRSLEIFLTTGKRASDIYAQQQAQQEAAEDTRGPWEALMFWVYSKPTVLNDRLDRRIGKMEQRGLMDEVRTLATSLDERSLKGEQVDRSRGIWQSIGFKQMEPLLEAEKRNASAEELSTAKEEGLELMRIATRQYARSQIKWLKGKTAPELKKRNALSYFYLVDSSDVDAFSTNVLEPAEYVTRSFLKGQPLPSPNQLSEIAQEVLSVFAEGTAATKAPIKTFFCESCNITLGNEEQWNKHLMGRRHKRALKSKSRMALIPVNPTSEEASGP